MITIADRLPAPGLMTNDRVGDAVMEAVDDALAAAGAGVRVPVPLRVPVELDVEFTAAAVGVNDIVAVIVADVSGMAPTTYVAEKPKAVCAAETSSMSVMDPVEENVVPPLDCIFLVDTSRALPPAGPCFDVSPAAL